MRDHQLSGIVEDNNKFQNDNGSINHIRYITTTSDATTLANGQAAT